MRILAILLCLVPFSATAQQQSVSPDDLIAERRSTFGRNLKAISDIAYDGRIFTSSGKCVPSDLPIDQLIGARFTDDPWAKLNMKALSSRKLQDIAASGLKIVEETYRANSRQLAIEREKLRNYQFRPEYGMLVHIGEGSPGHCVFSITAELRGYPKQPVRLYYTNQEFHSWVRLWAGNVVWSVPAQNLTQEIVNRVADVTNGLIGDIRAAQTANR